LTHVIHPLHNRVDTDAAITFVEGNGAVLRDKDGREYIDGLSSLWNVNLGHGRRELADAASEQMRRLAYTSAYSGYTNEPAARLADRLVQLSYPNMSGVYFTTGGAESNETAFKLARYFWRRQGKPTKTKIISRVHGYHGLTMAAMSATGIPIFHAMFQPLVTGFVHIVPSYPYRYPGSMAEALEEAIVREGPETVAAFIAEPVIGAGGVIPPTPDYFPKIRRICYKHSVLFIADEVITGFGRTGKWFALGHWGVEPDMVSFAKGVTSAYLPLGGVIVSSQIHGVIHEAPPTERFMHAATYSGHPTCCAVGLKTLEIYEREKLIDKTTEQGKRLLDRLQILRNLAPVGEIRGFGLMCGVELVEDQRTKKPALGLGAKVLAEARKRGLITRMRTGQGGEHPIGDTICLAPPFVTTEEQIDRIAQTLHESILAAAS
jgi:adenosylmethionine-8-amino-7-oxononanoate aminotransferase